MSLCDLNLISGFVRTAIPTSRISMLLGLSIWLYRKTRWIEIFLLIHVIRGKRIISDKEDEFQENDSELYPVNRPKWGWKTLLSKIMLLYHCSIFLATKYMFSNNYTRHCVEATNNITNKPFPLCAHLFGFCNVLDIWQKHMSSCALAQLIFSSSPASGLGNSLSEGPSRREISSTSKRK